MSHGDRCDSLLGRGCDCASPWAPFTVPCSHCGHWIDPDTGRDEAGSDDCPANAAFGWHEATPDDDDYSIFGDTHRR